MVGVQGVVRGAGSQGGGWVVGGEGPAEGG